MKVRRRRAQKRSLLDVAAASVSKRAFRYLAIISATDNVKLKLEHAGGQVREVIFQVWNFGRPSAKQRIEEICRRLKIGGTEEAACAFAKKLGMRVGIDETGGMGR